MLGEVLHDSSPVGCQTQHYLQMPVVFAKLGVNPTLVSPAAK